MINLEETIQNACEITRQDERRKFKEYLEKKRDSITNYAQARMYAPIYNEIINELFPTTEKQNNSDNDE